jgi:NAD-dependent SIR2 family protein deacetylase
MKYELAEAYPILEDLLANNKLVLFAGSGISIDSGLPDWGGLIKEFITMVEQLSLVDEDDKNDLTVIVNDAKARITANRFDPIQIATVLKKRLKDCEELYQNKYVAYQQYNSWVSRVFTDKDPNKKHDLIIKTNYPFILTSNYDNLFQKAAINNKFPQIELYTYKEQLEIMSAIHNGKPCIIHVHGTANTLNIDELIFTKEDYNKIILKKYEGFSFALRILFTRYSTLFVGYGASDPHLEEVLEELAEYFPLEQPNVFILPQSFLVTLRDKADSIMEAYKDRVRTNLIIIDSYSQYDDLLTNLKNKFPRP